MSPGILGKKIGMTQMFQPDGQAVPVTLLKAGPCTVVQRKTPTADGYDAVQLGVDVVHPADCGKHVLQVGLSRDKLGCRTSRCKNDQQECQRAPSHPTTGLPGPRWKSPHGWHRRYTRRLDPETKLSAARFMLGVRCVPGARVPFPCPSADRNSRFFLHDASADNTIGAAIKALP